MPGAIRPIATGALKAIATVRAVRKLNDSFKGGVNEPGQTKRRNSLASILKKKRKSTSNKDILRKAIKKKSSVRGA